MKKLLIISLACAFVLTVPACKKLACKKPAPTMPATETTIPMPQPTVPAE